MGKRESPIQGKHAKVVHQRSPADSRHFLRVELWEISIHFLGVKANSKPAPRLSSNHAQNDAFIVIGFK